MNDTFQLAGITADTTVRYVNHTFHAISLFEIILALGGYAVLVWFYIKVNRDKDKYSKWANPKGKVINLVKIAKMYIILYPVTIILLAALQIWLSVR